MTLSGRADTTHGIGARLRAERERLRISIDAVERGTLIRRDFLELIDAERLDDLPSGAYAKGFIRSYATFLGLDPAPFIATYDKLYAQPEPELARVVRRGVRVPPDLQRRAWKVAVGGAAVTLLVLALLGVFRSDGQPQEIPRVSKTSAQSAAQPASNPMGAIVKVEVTGEETWVEAEADGQQVFGATLLPGDSRTFKAEDRIVLYVARAREVSVTANGQILGTPDADSYRGTFTPTTTDFPANVTSAEEPAASPDTSAPPSPDTEVGTPQSPEGEVYLPDLDA